MKAGERVRITRGELEGRTGYVQAVSVDGAAVALPADPPHWPTPSVRVVDLGDLVRAPMFPWRARLSARLRKR